MMIYKFYIHLICHIRIMLASKVYEHGGLLKNFNLHYRKK